MFVVKLISWHETRRNNTIIVCVCVPFWSYYGIKTGNKSEIFHLKSNKHEKI